MHPPGRLQEREVHDHQPRGLHRLRRVPARVPDRRDQGLGRRRSRLGQDQRRARPHLQGPPEGDAARPQRSPAQAHQQARQVSWRRMKKPGGRSGRSAFSLYCPRGTPQP
ncbi:MAG: hypothetical protein NDJ72_02790 [Elusimicrobia bacterium]|nr:hypothetical protein [Elusimicrobiota bacterium]